MASAIGVADILAALEHNGWQAGLPKVTITSLSRYVESRT